MQQLNEAETTLPARSRRGRAERNEPQVRLHVVRSADPHAEGKIWSLGRENLRVGRQVDGLGYVADPAVSRQHVELRPDPEQGTVRVIDLDSHNGTWINGERRRSDVVQSGSVVRVGGTVFVVEIGVPPLLPDPEPSSQLPGQSWQAGALRRATMDAAMSPRPVLIQGETGTGKQHVCGELHRLAALPGGLVVFHTAAATESDLESSLFGPQAAGGAAAPGRLTEAHDGMLMLDEIGELSPALQPKLLRLFDARQVRPTGHDRDVEWNVRLAAATNSDLERLRREGRFRPDLLARLKGSEIQLPPLRERRADLLDYADALVPLDREGLPVRSWRAALAAETVEALLLHGWPYNLRELAAVLRGLLPLCAHPPILPDDLPGSLQPQGEEEAALLPRQSRMPPREELRRLLQETRGNIDAIARHYGKHRKQVYRWLQYNGVDAVSLSAVRDSGQLPSRRPEPGR